eukprot:g14598.t1
MTAAGRAKRGGSLGKRQPSTRLRIKEEIKALQQKRASRTADKKAYTKLVRREQSGIRALDGCEKRRVMMRGRMRRVRNGKEEEKEEEEKEADSSARFVQTQAARGSAAKGRGVVEEKDAVHGGVAPTGTAVKAEGGRPRSKGERRQTCAGSKTGRAKASAASSAGKKRQPLREATNCLSITAGAQSSNSPGDLGGGVGGLCATSDGEASSLEDGGSAEVLRLGENLQDYQQQVSLAHGLSDSGAADSGGSVGSGAAHNAERKGKSWSELVTILWDVEQGNTGTLAQRTAHFVCKKVGMMGPADRQLYLDELPKENVVDEMLSTVNDLITALEQGSCIPEDLKDSLGINSLATAEAVRKAIKVHRTRGRRDRSPSAVKRGSTKWPAEESDACENLEKLYNKHGTAINHGFPMCTDFLKTIFAESDKVALFGIDVNCLPNLLKPYGEPFTAVEAVTCIIGVHKPTQVALDLFYESDFDLPRI